MVKKKSKTTYTSKGVHRNVSKSTLRLMKPTDKEKFLNKYEAYLNGKNPWFTIENPNKTETNRKFIRVRAEDWLGSLKDRNPYMIRSAGNNE